MEFLDAAELRARLPMSAAIDALEAGFRGLHPSLAPPRSHVETARGGLLLMPAFGPAGVGVKLVTLTPENPARDLPFINAVYVLFDAETQEPKAVIDGAELTALRTAAVSGLATRYMAREDSRRLVLFGAGVQARSHLEAMRAVRPIEEVAIVSPTRSHADLLAEEARASGLRAEMADASAVRSADIVCTCTTSPEPLFPFAYVPPGLHVNAVGAYQPHARELDTATIAVARLVVETRDAALGEAGDVLIPIGEGAIDPSHVVADLSELAHGVAVRTSEADVTVFKSVGIGFEDLVVASAAVNRR
jgi:ornithine cyclodeaminase